MVFKLSFHGVCAHGVSLSTTGQCSSCTMHCARSVHSQATAEHQWLVVPLQVFNECKPNGVISPETCEYYQRWLEF